MLTFRRKLFSISGKWQTVCWILSLPGDITYLHSWVLKGIKELNITELKQLWCLFLDMLLYTKKRYKIESQIWWQTRFWVFQNLSIGQFYKVYWTPQHSPTHVMCNSLPVAHLYPPSSHHHCRSFACWDPNAGCREWCSSSVTRIWWSRPPPSALNCCAAHLDQLWCPERDLGHGDHARIA